MKLYYMTRRTCLYTWLFGALRLGFAALLALGVASAGWASVTIGGQPLDNVHDIMAATNQGVRAFEKASLLMTWWRNSEGSSFSRTFHNAIVAFDSDGNVAFDSDGNARRYEASKNVDRLSNFPDVRGGIYPIAFSDGKGGIARIASGSDKSSTYGATGRGECEAHVAFTTAEAKDGGLSFKSVKGSGWGNEDYQTYGQNEWKGYRYLNTGVAGPLSIPGLGEDVFVDPKVCIYSQLARHSNGSQDMTQDYSVKLRAWAVSDASVEYNTLWTVASDVEETIKKKDENVLGYRFPVASAAAGDFDGDGIRDEVAVLYGGGKDDTHYHIAVYKISFDGSNLNCTKTATMETNSVFHSRTEGGALVAGDFDGDTKTEIAAVTSDKSNNKNRSYISVEVFKYSGGSWTSKAYVTRDNRMDELQLSNAGNGAQIRQYGLHAVAADLSGTGRDKIVTLARHGEDGNRDKVFLSVWECNSGISPVLKGVYDMREGGATDIVMPLGKVDNDAVKDACNWNVRNFSLAAGPFTGTVRPAGHACDDIAFSLASTENANGNADAKKQRVWIVRTKLGSDGDFAGFENPVKIFEDTQQGAMGLTACDFLSESVTLEEPSHMKLEAYKSYAAVLQVPPYHVDAIQAPWVSSAPTAPVNFTHLGRTVKHTNSQSGGADSDTKATVKTFSEQGWDYGADIGGGKGIAKKAVKGIGFNFSAGYSGGLKDASSQTQTEANKKSANFTMDTSLTTSLTDALMYYQTDMHIWRYPVSKPVPSWLFGSLIEANEDFDKTGTANGDVFVTYTMCDEPQTVMSESLNSSNYDDYAPSHEEGNLFSYPNSAARGMDNAQLTLGNGLNFTLNVTTDQSVKFTRSGSSTETQESTSKHTETNGFHSKGGLSGRIKALFSVGGSGNASYADTYGTEVGDTSSFTKTWSGTEGITVSAPTGDVGFNTGYVDYTTEMQTYADAAGILNTAFGVSFSDGWLWKRNTRESPQSPYVEKPDPALVLPGRFNRKMARDAGGSYPVWEFNLDASSATKIRGMTFYSSVTKENVTAALEQGLPYTISVPIYNASFVDAGDVTVEFGYEADGAQTPLGRKTVTLKGWNNADMDEPNKATVSFDWTPDLAEGDYDFYVKLDPDDRIDEVHETWSHETPAGNNYGYHPFSVVNSAATATTLAAEKETVSKSDFSLVFVDLEAEDQTSMSAAEFRRYAISRGGDFRAAGRITYNGSVTLTNVCVDVMRNMPDGTRRHVSNRHIPVIRPGKTREFSFVVDHEKMGEGILVVDIASDQGGIIAGVVSSGGSSSSSSGGCETGFGALALVALLGLALRRR